MLNATQAVEQVRQMINWRNAEADRLDRIHRYLTGDYDLSWLPTSIPDQVRQLGKISKVNLVRLVVNSSTQGLYVDGYRSREQPTDDPAWDIWQRNRLDKRQIGVHRAAVSYGASYETVLPGDPVPVIRGVSPRKITTVYGPDDDWPMWALEKRRTTSGKLWRLLDDTHVYWVGEEKRRDFADPEFRFLESEEHGAGVTPVVRFRETEDLDDEVTGEVEPHMAVQDQINLTTFGLLVAQHYGAFKQRYILGWLAETEEQKLKASAATLMTFEDHPDDISVGEFDQTDLSGYLESREASLRHLATMSQTPVHELTAQLVNLSAEALVAARDSARSKRTAQQVVLGESHEQKLELAGRLANLDTDPAAWVRWKNTDAQSLGQYADALGKFAQMLGIPPQALWEQAAEALGVSQQELEEWKTLAGEGDPVERLMAQLDRQAVGSN